MEITCFGRIGSILLFLASAGACSATLSATTAEEPAGQPRQHGATTPTSSSHGWDVVMLEDGKRVSVAIRTETEDFYVVHSQAGTVQRIDKDGIKEIHWQAGKKPAGLLDHDTIVLLNGHVLTGTIFEENKKYSYYRMKSALGPYEFHVAKSQIERLYRMGKRQRGE